MALILRPLGYTERTAMRLDPGTAHAKALMLAKVSAPPDTGQLVPDGRISA